MDLSSVGYLLKQSDTQIDERKKKKEQERKGMQECLFLYQLHRTCVEEV